VNRRTLRPLQPWFETFLSSRSRFFLHLQGCLHTTQSRQVIRELVMYLLATTHFRHTWGSNHYPLLIWILMLHLHQQIPSTLRKIMQLDWLNGSNPSSNMFMTSFNKLSKTNSPARQASHQGSNLAKASPSPTGTNEILLQIQYFSTFPLHCLNPFI
jgi:hypothetical protein